jgi:hypothetical protein
MAIQLIQRILGGALLIQTIEYLLLQSSFSEKGIWRWSTIRNDFYYLPKNIQQVLNFFLQETIFVPFLWMRIILIGLFITPFSFGPHLLISWLILFSTFLISQRFRGSFNGGSDYMALIVLLALCAESLAPHHLLSRPILWIISLQSVTSYFMAGLVKIKRSDWRTGKALTLFIHSPNYAPPIIIKNLLKEKYLAFIMSWLIILFELSFPLIFFQHNSILILCWLSLGFFFHLNNLFNFGLNRFLFVWLSTYPAIYYCTVR